MKNIIMAILVALVGIMGTVMYYTKPVNNTVIVRDIMGTPKINTMVAKEPVVTKQLDYIEYLSPKNKQLFIDNPSLVTTYNSLSKVCKDAVTLLGSTKAESLDGDLTPLILTNCMDTDNFPTFYESSKIIDILELFRNGANEVVAYKIEREYDFTHDNFFTDDVISDEWGYKTYRDGRETKGANVISVLKGLSEIIQLKDLLFIDVVKTIDYDITLVRISTNYMNDVVFYTNETCTVQAEYSPVYNSPGNYIAYNTTGEKLYVTHPELMSCRPLHLPLDSYKLKYECGRDCTGSREGECVSSTYSGTCNLVPWR